jgi:hypothetical protein
MNRYQIKLKKLIIITKRASVGEELITLEEIGVMMKYETYL